MPPPGRSGALLAALSGVGAVGGLELGAALALATLVSEDLTCIAAGLLVSSGRMSFVAASLACFLGILVGDLLLVGAGRWLGRPAVARLPLRWLVSPGALERGERWFARRGPAVVFASRFFPGSRLPLFLAAGVLHSPVLPLAAALALAGALWTPLLVGLSAATGGAIRRELELWGGRALPVALLAAGVVLLLVKVLLPALTWRGRRRLLSRWRRLTRWEFWPLRLFQLPVILDVLVLGLRFRSLTLFTAANPGIPAGGFVGESKSAILAAIGARDAVPRFRALSLPEDAAGREAVAAAAHAEALLGWPVVGKPDRGERGSGVTVIRTPAELAAWARTAPREAILQEHVAGEEFGVFWVRRPSEPAGRILSITSKEFPAVVGDGRRTLEELVLADERAVCQAALHLERLAARLDEVPTAGERVALVEIGNHCRGTTFRDGRALETPALARRIDEIARSLPGFCFGRFDLRVPSVDELRAGRGLKILEVNGVTSEATHIYEPGASLVAAYRTLFAQWRLAFEIGRENAARGARPATPGELLALLRDRRRERTGALRAGPGGWAPR